jgi:phosphotriesterase-related protein
MIVESAERSDTRAPNGVVRTVLGDIPASDLGVCYAHEHLVIDGGIAKIINPEISLQDTGAAVAEVEACRQAGVHAMVDTMPADAGRNVARLVEISRRTGVHLVAVTGLHHARYYGERHWSELLEPAEMAELFIGDLEIGIDAHDLNGPVVRRTPHRAGLVKVAGSDGGPSVRDLRTFEAAAITVARTGAALMTHCEGGGGGVQQLEALAGLGVPLERVILSHTDKVADLGYHRALLQSGCSLVYDQGIRTATQTTDLVGAALEGGWLDRILLGTDGARRSLWSAFGGSPGLAALWTDLGASVAQRWGAEASAALWVDNPARALALA